MDGSPEFAELWLKDMVSQRQADGSPDNFDTAALAGLQVSIAAGPLRVCWTISMRHFKICSSFLLLPLTTSA